MLPCMEASRRTNGCSFGNGRRVSGFLSMHGEEIKRVKGIWWMPWCAEAMKDVARCDKPRGVASRL